MSILPIIATAAIAAPCGFLVCAFLTAGKVAEAQSGIDENAAHWQRMWKHALDTSTEHAAAHSRCADALQQNRDRIESALLQITPGANATVKRIERILRGEQG